MHLRISNRSIKTSLTGLLLAHCPQKYIKCWSETIAIASWAFLIPISVSSTCSSPPPHFYIQCFQLQGGGGGGLLCLCGLCVSIYESLPLKATASQAATAYTAASIRTFDLLPWGRKNAKSMQTQSFHIYVIRITFALWELSILLLCVCVIALGIGSRVLHD